jgi:hypothetical protein
MIKMTDTPRSRSITAYGYDEATQELRVHLRRSGDVFSFVGVPLHHFRNMQACENKSRYYERHILPNYKSTKVTTSVGRPAL